MKITVFTPTFNREATLPAVYGCLLRQDFDCFEWLIVDDGSDDDTRMLVEEWQEISPFPIVYSWQKNRGKPSAFNRGVGLARGELFFCLDSDDQIVENALSSMWALWETRPRNKSIGSITCPVVNQPYLTTGKTPDHGEVCDPRDLYFELRGETWGGHTVSVLRENLFPIIPGENFIPESVVWLKIAERSKTIWHSQPMRIYEEATENSLSSQVKELRKKNIGGFMLHYTVEYFSAKSLRDRIKAFSKILYLILRL